MRVTEEAKHAQWGPVYGDEWIPRWVYPDRLVENGEALTFDGVSFRVFEVGPGGDCDANSVWILEDEPDAAFVGDLVSNGAHSYIADGRVLRWLANIDREEMPAVTYPLPDGLGWRARSWCSAWE